MEMLWRIEAPHFVAGVVVKDGKIIHAAPILKWSIGRSWSETRRYFVKKGWHGQPLK